MLRLILMTVLLTTAYTDIATTLECEVASPEHVVCVMTCTNLGPDQSNYAWGVMELPDGAVTVVGIQNDWGTVAVAPEDNDVLWWSHDGTQPLASNQTGTLTVTLRVRSPTVNVLARVATGWVWEKDEPGNNEATGKILMPWTFLPLVQQSPVRQYEEE